MKTHKKRLNLVDTRARGRSTPALLGLLVVSLLAFGAAKATGNKNNDQNAQEQGQAQGQAQGQLQGQGQAQGQTVDVDIQIGGGGEDGAGTLASGGSASAQGGEVTINQNREAQGDYEVKFRNNPNVYTNPPAPTVSCYKTGGFGGSGGGVGLSLGGGKIDPYCVEREEIRLAAAIGMTTQARFRWCNLENNLNAFHSVGECLGADTSVVSDDYQLLLKEKNRIERELRETQTVIAARCAKAEESNERLEEAWLECIAK